MLLISISCELMLRLISSPRTPIDRWQGIMALVALRSSTAGGQAILLCIRRHGSTLVVWWCMLLSNLALRAVLIIVVNGLKQHSWNGLLLPLNVLTVLTTLAGGK